MAGFNSAFTEMLISVFTTTSGRGPALTLDNLDLLEFSSKGSERRQGVLVDDRAGETDMPGRS